MISSLVREHRLALVAVTVAGFVACGDDDPMQPSNEDPVAVIAADPLEVPSGDNHQTVVTLDGSGSSDPDGDPLTFAWTAPSGNFVNGTTAGSEIAEVTFPGAAPYDVVLVVQDGRGGSATADVTIGLSGPANQPPTAAITANPTSVPAGDNNQTVVTLDGTGSSDPEGDDLSYSWTVQSGTFVNGTGSTSPVAEVTFPGNAPYAVTLTVSDGNGNEDTAQTTIAVS